MTHCKLVGEVFASNLCKHENNSASVAYRHGLCVLEREKESRFFTGGVEVALDGEANAPPHDAVAVAPAAYTQSTHKCHTHAHSSRRPLL